MFLGDPLAVLHLTHQKIANVLADLGINCMDVFLRLIITEGL